MPKVTADALPVSGMFGVVKPSGPTSMKVLDDIKPLLYTSKLFVDKKKLAAAGKDAGKGKGKKRGKWRKQNSDLKIGQGGTLDPLADGVLVVAVGKATKRLNDFLDCPKEYTTTCLLGCETDSYDSEGSRVRSAPWRHVTREMVEQALEPFRGNIEQTPPLFSALKMDGKPLYEYARKGIPLPRPIDKRPVTIHELELVEWKGSDHSFRWPEKVFTQEERDQLAKMLSTVPDKASVKDEPEEDADTQSVPSAFVLRMRVSGGTYVRSLVHDVAHAVGSAGHVVTLQRSRQKSFALQPTDEGDYACVAWETFANAIENVGERGEDGWLDWEREVADKLLLVDEKEKQV